MTMLCLGVLTGPAKGPARSGSDPCAIPQIPGDSLQVPARLGTLALFLRPNANLSIAHRPRSWANPAAQRHRGHPRVQPDATWDRTRASWALREATREGSLRERRLPISPSGLFWPRLRACE